MPKPVRTRSKACARCAQVSPVLYRVITDDSLEWKLLCPVCRRELEGHPAYRYGGTWKANKRH
jgi:hypothetical protein